MRAKRSEIFRVQKQAWNAGFEFDSIDAGFIVLASQVLADRNATEQQHSAARRVLECWRQSLVKGDHVITFSIYLLPDDEADQIEEDVDLSKLSREDLVLLMLPGMDDQEWKRRTNAAGHNRPEFVETNLKRRALIAKQFEMQK